MIYANYMLCPGLQKDPSNEFWVTSGHKYKFKLAFVLSYHFLQVILANKFAASFVIFEHKEISLVFVLLVKLFAQFNVIQEAVTTKVDTKWILSKHFLHALRRTLSLRDVDLNLSCRDTVNDFDILFVKVQWLKPCVRIVRLFEQNGWSKHERKVELFFKDFELVDYILNLWLVLFQYLNLTVDLVNFWAVLRDQVPLEGYAEYWNLCFSLDHFRFKLAPQRRLSISCLYEGVLLLGWPTVALVLHCLSSSVNWRLIKYRVVLNLVFIRLFER